MEKLLKTTADGKVEFTFNPFIPAMTQVHHSWIKAIGWSEVGQAAYVQMGDRVYRFFGLRKAQVTRWLKAEHKGHYYHTNIKGQYASERFC
jgi:hypothetical protein